MNPNDFEYLRQTSVETDVKLSKMTDEQILKKNLELPYLYHKYLDVFIKEKREFDELNSKLKKKYSELYDKYKFKSDFSLDSKSEISIYVEGDESYNEVLLEFNFQQRVIEFLTQTLDNIKRMSFSIKNYIQLKEFLSGK